MNIFALDNDPAIAATYLCDKHVPKMLLESAQLLSTLARYYVPQHRCDAAGLYKSTHQKHPCQLWLQDNPSNWAWLLEHAEAINEEYDNRFNKQHKSYPVMLGASEILKDNAYGYTSTIHYTLHTPFVQCMPEQYYIENDPVTAYRKYYVYEKRYFARWKRGTPQPEWFTTQVKELLCSAPNVTARQLKLRA
jgi:hypothetical protein